MAADSGRAASAAAVIAAAALGGSTAVGVLAFVIGTVALGALSIGHEYTNHTLTLLLLLPADRRRLFLVKLGVLAPMLLTLGAIAVGILFAPHARDPAFLRNGTFPFLAVLCGLFVAPWLTMVCRTPLAGIVFSLSILGLMHLFADVRHARERGWAPRVAWREGVAAYVDWFRSGAA